MIERLMRAHVTQLARRIGAATRPSVERLSRPASRRIRRLVGVGACGLP